MLIEAGPCRIRSWQYKDLPSLTRNANNVKIWRGVRDLFPSPYTEAHAERWLELAINQHPECNFAIEVGDSAVGGIGLVMQLDVHRLGAELGYWLGEEYWGKGIMTAAVRHFTEFAHSTYGLVRIYALVYDWNLASAKVLEKNGYVLEARLQKNAVKNGEIIDELLFASVR